MKNATSIFFLLMGLFVIGAGGFFAYKNPEDTSRILGEVDFLGVTAAGEEEQLRRFTIMGLEVGYEKKLVLIDRKVFLGCTTQMAKLALGEPEQTYKEGSSLYWIYQLPGDKRPTTLIFVHNKLAKAYKSSYLDLKAPAK